MGKSQTLVAAASNNGAAMRRSVQMEIFVSAWGTVE